MLKRADTIGTILSEEFSDDFEIKNVTYLRNAINRYSELPSIGFISVIDNNNFVVFSSIKEVEEKQNRQDDSTSIKKEKGDYYIKSFQMVFNGRKNGIAKIRFFS